MTGPATDPAEPDADPAGPDALVEVVARDRVVLCLGSGGVGKTTTSAALALALAARGERVVVLTIDPARRLADALGLSGSLGNRPTRIDLPPIPNPDPDRSDPDVPADDPASSQADRDSTTGGQVWAAMLDPAETFEAVIRAEAADEETAERILANRLFTNLTTSLSGTNEYMAAERLHQLTADPRFDRVIVDTPPSRHMLDFLDSPGRLTRFVDHRLYRSVFAPKRGILRPLDAGAKTIMRLLARLVGSSLVDDVVSFFADFEGLDQGFRRRASEIDQLLLGAETAYLLVTSPRGDRLSEAGWILDNLARRNLTVRAVVMNRVLPIDPVRATEAAAALVERIPENPRGKAKRAAAEAAAALRQNLLDLTALARQEQAMIGRFRDEVGRRAAASRDAGTRRSQADGAVPMVTLPERRTPVSDLPGLAELAAHLAGR